jgi:hypothetical protein
VWQPVLVDVGKLVKLPEGIVGEPLPSVVRLPLLDSCLRALVDTPDFVAALPPVHCPIPKDGELQQPRPAFGQGVDLDMGKREVIDEVVEGGAQVMETVANDEPKFGGRVVEDFDPKELATDIGIGFGPSSVRALLEPSAPFRFKALQVMKRPV